MVEQFVSTLNAADPNAEAKLVRLSDIPMRKSPGMSSGAAILNTSENWERALMVCDLFGYEQKYVDLLQYGKEKAITNPLDCLALDTSAIQTEMATVTEVNNRYVNIMEAGMVDDVEAFYEEWKAELDSAGFEDVKAEFLRQAQEYYNSIN